MDFNYLHKKMQERTDSMDFETIDLDDTERAKATIRTAKSIDDLTEKLNQFAVVLEIERQERKESDKALKTIAIATLIANWGAVVLALLFRFL